MSAFRDRWQSIEVEGRAGAQLRSGADGDVTITATDQAGAGLAYNELSRSTLATSMKLPPAYP